MRVIAATNRQLGTGGGSRSIPSRPVLPLERPTHPRAIAARAEDGHPATGHVLHPAARKADRANDRGGHTRQHGTADAIRLAGNVRELENVIERALVLSTGGLPRSAATSSAGSRHGCVCSHDGESSECLGCPASSARRASSSLEDVERAYIAATLAKTGWVVEGPRGAAKILDMHPNTLRGRMKKLGVERGRYEISLPPRSEAFELEIS